MCVSCKKVLVDTAFKPAYWIFANELIVKVTPTQ